MPRILGEIDHELRFQDNISDCVIVLYYRMPETEERRGYNSLSIQRKGNKIINKTHEARMKYGSAILSGFRAGDFCIARNGKTIPIASDQNHPDYDPDWKKIVTNQASDLIELLALHVFDGSCAIAENEDEDQDDPEKK